MDHLRQDASFFGIKPQLHGHQLPYLDCSSARRGRWHCLRQLSLQLALFRLKPDLVETMI